MHKLNIYIVEDDPFIATMLVQTVIGMGHSVCGLATSAHKAINELEELNGDLVVSDILLNGQNDGIDLGDYINTHLHIPFIFQSSVTDTHVIVNALLTGASAVMAKPANKQKLELAINSSVNVLV